MKKTGLILNMIICILSIILCFGTKLLFHVCAPKEDGSWMSCHWAEQTVFGLSIVLLILSIIEICFRDGKTKSGIGISIIMISALMITVPNHLIRLCMMTEMRCHSVMKPSVIMINLLIIICSIVSVIIHRKEEIKT